MSAPWTIRDTPTQQDRLALISGATRHTDL